MVKELVIGIIIFGLLVAIFKLKNLVLSFSIFKYKIVYAFLVPLFLFSTWFYFSIREIYRQDNVLLQLTTEYNTKHLTNPDFSEQ